MISYVDTDKAIKFNNMYKKNKNKLINLILRDCENIFNIPKIKKPIYTKICFWKNGVGGWKANYDS